jgi:hypothetical protein
LIISASYKTDIPTFYGEWLMNRLDAGYCKVHNPYGGKPFTVSLLRPDVDGFVFWTKNLGPFMQPLALIHERTFRFVVQYTINSYPRALELSVVGANSAIGHMRTLSERYGENAAVWRYDTIVFTSETPFEFHVENFKGLAEQLRGTTNEVVISFVQMYRKTEKNLNLASDRFGFTWTDPSADEKRRLVKELFRLAQQNRMLLTICSQPELLDGGAEATRCVDAVRLSRIFGQSIQAKLQANRVGCGCYASKDIGEYDTCPHGCVYCYAVRNRELAQRRHGAHDPRGEFLYESAAQLLARTP